MAKSFHSIDHATILTCIQKTAKGFNIPFEDAENIFTKIAAF